jgi:hypothetical protein
MFNPELMNVTEVRSRGWSRHLIDTLLGEPDEVRRNPRSGSRNILLYAKQRVEEAERLKSL